MVPLHKDGTSQLASRLVHLLAALRYSQPLLSRGEPRRFAAPCIPLSFPAAPGRPRPTPLTAGSAPPALPPTGGSYRSRERAERRGSANSGAVPELGVAGAAASSSSLAAAATSSTNCQRSAPLPRGNSGPRPVRSSVEEGARCGTCGTPKCGSLCPVVSGE